MSRRIVSLMAAAAAAALSAGMAHAQTAPQPQPDPPLPAPARQGGDATNVQPSSSAPQTSEAATLEELVVTAQRRETSLQDVPFSIMAFGADQVQQQRITDAFALSQRVPSAVFNAAADKGFAVMGLRGVRALLSAPAADLPVVFFFDDVYTSGVSSTGSTFFDVDRVEVLRGPQGTLFGRNVTGGAVSINTKRPVFDTDWGASITAGNFGQLAGEGFLNGVLIENKLAGRVSYKHSENDGLFENTAGPNLQAEKVDAVRGQLLWTPNEELTVRVAADYMRDTGTSNPAKVTCVTSARQDCNPVSLPPRSSDPFTVDQNDDASYAIRYYGALVRADWDLGVGTLTSITAVRRNVNFSNRDPDSIPLSVYYLKAVTNDRQFTQELRFSTPDTDRFSYVAGLFLLRQHNYRRDEYNERGIPGTPFGTTNPVYRFAEINQFSDNGSYAAFAEGAFKITPTIIASVGGRYTVDKKEGYTYINGTPGTTRFPVVPTTVFFGPKEFSAFTPRVYLRWEPTSDLNFYATVARGFKGGGFSASQNSVAGLITPFAPEKVTNYEVGTKSRFFDRRLQVNLTLFTQNIENLQATFFENGQSFTRSVGEARQQGVELESAWQPTRNLNLFLNYAYLDARYLEYNTGTASYAGKVMPFAPKNSVAVGGRYTIPVNDAFDVQLAGDYSFRSRLSLNDPNTTSRELMERSVWNMFNASADIVSTDGRWKVSFWGKNLANEAIVQAAYDQGTFWLTPAERARGDLGYLTYYNNPRTYGVTLSIKR